jgi:hypothetical protein
MMFVACNATTPNEYVMNVLKRIKSRWGFKLDHVVVMSLTDCKVLGFCSAMN